MKTINSAMLAITIGFLSLTANAAILNIDGIGKLIGASGVSVDGLSYDVAFIDGTCETVYDGCNDPEDFQFASLASAFLAAQAILDQVFLDVNLLQQFDSLPNTTNGCTFNADPDNCFALTPVGDSLPLPENQVAFPNIDVVFTRNTLTDPFDGTSGPFFRSRALYDSATMDAENAVWAKWTLVSTLPPPLPVPEPGTLGLLGAGLIGLAWRRRRAFTP